MVPVFAQWVGSPGMRGSVAMLDRASTAHYSESPRSGCPGHRHWVSQTPRTAQPTERRLAGTESGVARSVACLGVLARVAVAPGWAAAVAVQRCAVPASARPMAVPRFEAEHRSWAAEIRWPAATAAGCWIPADSRPGCPGSPERPSCRWICHCPDREPGTSRCCTRSVGRWAYPAAASGTPAHYRNHPRSRHQSVQWELVAQWHRAAPKGLPHQCYPGRSPRPRPPGPTSPPAPPWTVSAPATTAIVASSRLPLPE